MKEFFCTNIMKDDKYFYLDAYYGDAGKRMRFYGRTEDEVYDKIAARREHLRRQYGELIPSPPYLSDCIRFYLDCSKARYGRQSRERYEKLCRVYILNTFIDKDVRQITAEDRAAFCERLLDDCYATTVKSVNVLISRTLEFIRLCGIEDVPAWDEDGSRTGASAKSGSEKSGRALSKEEHDALIAAADNRDVRNYSAARALICFCTLSGLKFSEASEMRSEDIDAERSAVRIKDRSFPISKECMEWLQRYMKEYPGDGYVFNAGGAKLTGTNVNRVLDRLLKSAGLPKSINGRSIQRYSIAADYSAGMSADQLAEKYGKNKQAIYSSLVKEWQQKEQKEQKETGDGERQKRSQA